MNKQTNNYRLIPISETISDQDKPLSFQVWKNSFEVILPEQAYTQYNEYLTNWYKNKEANNTDLKANIKINFLNLLKQVQVFFTEEEKENWYTGIDVDNEKEVLLAIPYFARKLRDISLYYLQLRQEVKRSKLKYNLAGSNQNAVRQIQEILLQNFSKRNNQIITLPSTLWSSTPKLSAIKNNIVIEVEELYDTASYFDRTVTIPASTYFTIDSETEKYFLQKGINLSDIDWAYRLGTFTVSALYDPNLQGSITNGASSLYFDLAQKYLGSDRYSTFFIPSSARKDFFTINVQAGNNFFYYPFGPYKTNVLNLPRYTPVPLSSTELQTLGTPGSSIEEADTIFIKTKLGTEGAWLRKQAFDIESLNMIATLEGANSTIFRFPYPGYGVSAEDIDWTGYGLITDPRFFYLDNSTKKTIENVYWGNSFALSGISPISINSTSLVANGAYASKTFSLADKIRVWPTPPQFNSDSYSGSIEEAWLYKFTKTSISIATNNDSVIIWPYAKVNPNRSGGGTKIPEYPGGICLPEPLSGINLPYATGGIALSSADVIYKVTNIYDRKEDAVECAWLSASTYHFPDKQTIGCRQSQFNILFEPNQYTYFIWDGDGNIDINQVIPGRTTHLPDCKFATTPDTTYKDHKLCTCGLTLFTPFGHPGEQYIDNTGLADFIVEDFEFQPPPQGAFNLSEWKDNENRSFATSPNAGWFKTNKKIGWGDGVWYSGAESTGNQFLLKKGKRYIYFRTGIRDLTPTSNNLPALAVRYKQSGVSLLNPVQAGTWMGAYKDRFDNWVSTDKPSGLVLNPNDLFIYSRAKTTSFSITSTYIQEVNLLENRGSIWSNYDYIATDNLNIPVTISYPFVNSNLLPAASANARDFYKQYPQVKAGDVLRIVQWAVTAPDKTISYFDDVSVASFIPLLTGLYTVAVTALTGDLSPAIPEQELCDAYYIFSNIPPITCDPNFIIVPTLTSFNIPVPGFVLETPLRGWNYTTNTPTSEKESLTGENIGARPIWAQSILDKSVGTDFKSVESWSPALTVVDTYNIIQQPNISEIILKGGERLEYKRIPQTQVVWKQDISLKNISSKREWCKIKLSTSNRTTPFVPENSLISYQTLEPSTLVLENVVENEPVEIYYNAINSFIWNLTAEPQITETTYGIPISSTVISSSEPWKYLTNQFYPTVAFLPSFDTLRTDKELGKYFKPNNLGLLTYVNKDYTFDLTLSSIKTTDLYETPSKKINNRGLTRDDQLSPFSIKTDNNIWLKQPYTTGSLAGTIKNSIFKQYQKFIPYQSAYESNSLLRLGLTTPASLQHPWGGPFDTDWNDPNNRPINFTGQINVDEWVNDQLLKNINLQLDNWASDIFGNQYGLYKNIKPLTPYERTEVTGQIWVRKNDQLTVPGYDGLIDVFDTYKNLSLYSELTGSGIKKLDVFYDTLLIETSGAVIFEKVQYDYDNAKIFSIADFSRAISLAVPTINNLNREFTNTLPLSTSYAKAGDTWFSTKQKTVFITVLELQNNVAIPNLYTFDLVKNDLKLVLKTEALSGIHINEITRPTLSYCTSKKEFLYSFTAKNIDNKDILVTLHIKQSDGLYLTDIKVYTPQTEEVYPPTVFSNLTISLTSKQKFNKQIMVEPQETSYFESINFPSWAYLSPVGALSGVAPQTPNTYTLEYKATNSVGSAFSSLIINVT